jgi:hypothetical protein
MPFAFVDLEGEESFVVGDAARGWDDDCLRLALDDVAVDGKGFFGADMTMWMPAHILTPSVVKSAW